jgi:hypothetical protein
VKFTQADIKCSKFSLNELIQIFEIFPNLDALEISLSPISLDDSVTSVSSSIVTKITKLKLDGADCIEHIDLLMKLCPQIEYFECDRKTEKDLEVLIRYIIKNSNTYFSKLKCLFSYVQNVHSKIIENLQIIIDLEKHSSINKTFNNYKLQCLGNYIFLFKELS